MDNFFNFVQLSGTSVLFKLGFSIVILLYAIFMLFVVNQVRSLNQLIFIRPANTSTLLFIIALAQFIFAIFLFLATLAIL
ncbi:MAG TPA: DUF5657 family protein [Patescibacteria group bacterium]|nr:DUF5657 family protein [Patescibacteria group bacterium]